MPKVLVGTYFNEMPIIVIWRNSLEIVWSLRDLEKAYEMYHFLLWLDRAQLVRGAEGNIRTDDENFNDIMGKLEATIKKTHSWKIGSSRFLASRPLTD